MPIWPAAKAFVVDVQTVVDGASQCEFNNQTAAIKIRGVDIGDRRTRVKNCSRIAFRIVQRRTRQS